MRDIQTEEYRESAEADTVPEKRGFPVYRILFGIQLVSMAIIVAAAKGWLN